LVFIYRTGANYGHVYNCDRVANKLKTFIC